LFKTLEKILTEIVQNLSQTLRYTFASCK